MGRGKDFVLTLVCYRKSIVLYMYGRISKCAETAQDNLNNFPICYPAPEYDKVYLTSARWIVGPGISM